MNKKRFIYLFILVFFCGVFLRVYHFSEWLHFELDQARDSFIIADSVENFKNLPLLGPQARGRELQLGPVFYYFQFISAKIFGASPVTEAFPDLLFSILTTPLVYLFSRQFFSKKVSFSLFTLTSFSYFLIVYGRFAWNPNSMPFWSILSAYSLLKSSEKFSRNAINRVSTIDWFKYKFATKEISWWFVLATLSLAVLMQLHFIAFLCFPVAFLSYSIFSKIQFSWKTILLSVLTFILLFSPIILSEIKTGGRNTQGLIDSVEEDKNENHNLAEKVFRAFQETSTYFLVVFSGDQNGGATILTRMEGNKHFICDDRCKSRLPILVIATLFFIISLFSFFYSLFSNLFKKENFSHRFLIFKKDGLTFKNKLTEIFTKLVPIFKQIFVEKNSLIFLIFPWLLMSGIFLTLVAYQISPRFYLFIFPPFLILVGSFFSFIENTFQKWGRHFIFIFVIILVISNLLNYRKFFKEIDLSRVKNIEASRDLVLNRADFITLSQLRDVADFISKNEKSGDVVVVGDNRYARAIYYLVSFENKSSVLECYIKRGGFKEKSVLNRDYYLLVRDKTESQINDKMKESHNVVLEKSFGTLKLFKLSPKNRLNLQEKEKIESCFIR